MDFKERLTIISDDLNHNEITEKEARKQICILLGFSGMLSDEVPNLFVTLAQQIHYESTVNGLDMTGVTECFNELQEAYKKERGNYR